MRKTKVIPLLLAAMMVISTAPAYAFNNENLVPQQKTYDTAFTDTEGTWCDAYVQICYEAGLMEGTSSTQFDPEGTLTNAQITVISARLLNLLRGGDGSLAVAQDGESWYQPAYDDLVEAGVLSESNDDSTSLPHFDDSEADVATSRFFFVNVLYAALEAAKVTLPTLNCVDSIPDVLIDITAGAPAVLSFYNAGILSGKDKYGSFDGYASLSRGQASAMLARLLDPTLRLTFTLDSFDLCRDVLQLPPDTVLFYTDGEAVTAELFGSTLIISLLQWGTDTTSEARDDAIQIWVNYTASYFALAKTVGVSLSDNQLSDAQQNAKEEAGFFGNSEASMLHSQCKSVLGCQLEQYYQNNYNQKTAMFTYHDALSASASAIKVEVTPALSTLDLKAVLARAINSPFAYD